VNVTIAERIIKDLGVETDEIGKDTGGAIEKGEKIEIVSTTT
jgi:hypothetical protein